MFLWNPFIGCDISKFYFVTFCHTSYILCGICEMQCMNIPISLHFCQHLLLSLGYSYATEYEAVSHFELHFPNDKWCWIYFSVLFAICISSLGKCLCPFFKWVVFLLQNCKSSLCLVTSPGQTHDFQSILWTVFSLS